MSRKSLTLRLGLAAAALALAVPAQAATAATSSTSSTVTLTTAQQRGLASLQHEIDATVARTGGRQTAVNEVSSADGRIVLSLPLPTGAEFLSGAPVGSVSGARAARPAAATAKAAATTGFRYGCPYSTTSFTGRWICLYQNTRYNGNSLGSTGPGNARMLKFQDAGYQALKKWDFDNRTSSVVNTSLRDWYLYNWRSGNPNCGPDDYVISDLFVGSAGSAGGYNGYATLAANDVLDCLVRYE